MTTLDPDIAAMVRFARQLTQASAAILVWVSDKGSFRTAISDGTPMHMMEQYLAGAQDNDPLQPGRLCNAGLKTASLSVEAAKYPADRNARHFSFLASYGFRDEHDLVFWDDSGPVAVLGLLMDEQRSGLEMVRNVAEIQEYLEYNINNHPDICAKRADRRLQSQFGLSYREVEVASLLTQGASNQTIGEILGISTLTVKTHVVRILDKLGADSRTSVAAKINALRQRSPLLS